MIVEDERKPTGSRPRMWQRGDTVMDERGFVWMCDVADRWMCLTGPEVGAVVGDGPNEWSEDVVPVECILRVVR